MHTDEKMEPNEKHIFLDTMMYMHFRPVEEVDWCRVADAQSVTVVVPRTVIQELDKHKNRHPSQKIRDRVRKFLAKLEAWAEEDPATLRQGVQLRVLPFSASVDFEAHSLDRNSGDDRLLAAMLAYMAGDSEATVVLISDDSAPRLTAKQLGIHSVRPPDEIRLPDEPTEAEKENRKLRRRIERLANALPVLSAQFATHEEGSTVVEYRIPLPEAEPRAEIDTQLEAVRAQHPHLSPPVPPKTPKASSHPFSDLAAKLASVQQAQVAFGAIPASEYERYNRSVDRYVQAYEAFLVHRWQRKNAARRTIKVEIEVANTGSCPAEDVDVRFHFPDGMDVWGGDNRPEVPKEPKPPEKPMSETQRMMSRAALMPNIGRIATPHFAAESAFKTFSIKRTNSFLVEDIYPRIKHFDTVQLETLYVEFESFEAAGSFHIDYELHPSNLPEPVTGQLHVVICKEGQADAGE